MKLKKTREFSIFALFLAIELLMQMTPIGFLRIGPIAITFLHIPVIIIAILLGKKYGILLGLVFGLCSIANNTFAPGPTSFCFSPFISVGNVQGNFFSLIIALVPRMWIGLGAYLLYQVFKKIWNNNLAMMLAALITTITHTILVLGMIYIFFGNSYAAATNVAYDSLLTVLLGVITSNGIVEAIVSAIVVPSVCKAIQKSGFVK